MFAKLAIMQISLLFITDNAYSHHPSSINRQQLSKQMAELVQKLDEKQRDKALEQFDSEHRKTWHYVPKSRRGLPLKSMGESQKRYVMETLKLFLSQQGFVAAATIINLESILNKEESGFFVRRDPEAYYLELFGNPDPQSIWGLSFEGHHLSLNYVIKANKIISFSPMFFGANPAHVKKDYGVGPAKGTRPLSPLEDPAFQLINSLTKKQKGQAIVSDEALSDVRGGGSLTPPQFEKTGILSKGFTKSQSEIFRKLINAYLDLLPKPVGNDIRAISDDELLSHTYFSWYGSLVAGVGHYYRIDHPKFVIELANTQSDVSGNPANHVHALWRTRTP